jgi:hypothetical protein
MIADFGFTGLRQLKVFLRDPPRLSTAANLEKSS